MKILYRSLLHSDLKIAKLEEFPLLGIFKAHTASTSLSQLTVINPESRQLLHIINWFLFYSWQILALHDILYGSRVQNQPISVH